MSDRLRLLSQWVKYKLVYWQWDQYTSLSHVHKMHPLYPGVTWCGCIYNRGEHPGILEQNIRMDALLIDIPVEAEVCSDCLNMRQPIVMPQYEDEATRRLIKEQRASKWHRSLQERAAKLDSLKRA